MPTKTMNILKASLPFVPVQMQRGLSYFIKIKEFNEMVQNFQEDTKSGLTACGVSSVEEHSFNLNEYLTAISPYLSKEEQGLIQMITNVVQALNIYSITKDLPFDFLNPAQPPAPSSTNVSSAHDPAKESAPSNSNNFSFDIEALKNMLSPEQKAMFDTYSSLLNNSASA